MSIIDDIDNYGKGAGVAHIYRGTTLSYSELSNKSNALASYIIEKFGKDKTPIVVFGHKQNEMLVCFLACVKSGHAYVPVDSSFPEQRVRDIIEGSKTKLVFDISGQINNAYGIQILTLDDVNNLINEYSGKIPDRSCMVKPDDIYYIIYTSGSTGKPKGVSITLSCLESFIKWGLSLCNLQKDRNYIFMNQAPFSFDLSVMDLYLALASGSTSYSIDKAMISNLRELFDYFKESHINIWVSTPSFVEMCLADSSFNPDLLQNIETFLFCGETLTNNCAKRLKDRFKTARIINTYGPTEATVAVTSIEIDDEIINFDPLPVGKVKDDCLIKIFDEKENEVPEGERGEIIIIGDSVSPGYYNNDEITKKSFFKMVIDGSEKRCYKTGDKGYIKNDMLYCCGRVDFQVKLNGYRIELEDIENNIRHIDFIRNSAVLPVVRDGRIQYLAAFVTLNKTINEKEFKIELKIKNELKKHVPNYMVPRKVVIKDSLPMTTNGKINRKLLMEEIK